VALSNNRDEFVVAHYFDFLKIIGVALFTTAQVDSKQRLRLLLWTIAISLGFYGFKSGLAGILSGGRLIIKQGPGGMLADNNDFALALVMNLPLLFYLGRAEKHPLVKRLCDVTFFLTIVTVLLTHSRGGFLAMTVTCFIMAYRAGRVLPAFALSVLGILAFVVFVPESVVERLSTIQEGGAESSAAARLKSWAGALRMIEAHPFWGVGLRNFQTQTWAFGVHYQGEAHYSHVAHNSYLQIWAENGSIAILTYLVLLGSVFVTTRWIRRSARRLPDMEWAFNYARMIEATTAGFMIGAFFLNRGHFDLFYHWCGLLTAFAFIYRAEVARTRQPAAVEVVRGVEVQRRAVAATPLPRWSRGY
jgi:probable O-glycosylation ligase (exosortase A-associated)